MISRLTKRCLLSFGDKCPSYASMKSIFHINASQIILFTLISIWKKIRKMHPQIGRCKPPICGFKKNATLLSRVIFIDETWVHFYDRKQNSNRWNDHTLVIQGIKKYVFKSCCLASVFGIDKEQSWLISWIRLKP